MHKKGIELDKSEGTGTVITELKDLGNEIPPENSTWLFPIPSLGPDLWIEGILYMKCVRKTGL
ncbi:hypothetical protein P7K49_038886, partial [Saguinus oedipus]